ncbi:dockerin type I domain-containing protein [Novipirellula artificiosorum]|uniref:Dockerin type I repeat protein n=1 Tax=Novipirellula artificiosorum TaxID=2528016 RepID=A0A5C6E3N2_9BACT|nr:dockerin type I domain-containing protein [Novipirellula artificiosorum]TWU42046.1 hypothetical protein Poly41_03420 [Novipirellula artificiosorum]
MFRIRSSQPRRRSAEKRKLRLESLEQRNLLAAAPIGMTEMDTGEFLLGSVAVTPVFFESDGSSDAETQNWSAAEIDAMLAKVDEGVNWWADTLDTFNTVHTLDFVVDDTYAADPVETPYELIDRNSEGFELAVAQWMDSLGYPGSDSVQTAVQQFNHDQRSKLGTDWAFTIFVIDSSDDPDGLFASGGYFSGAFAFAGGLFMVTPSSRPASTITHEMGHIFWTRDEYPGGGSWTDRRGYYDAQNWNAANNPTEGFVQEDSIMRSGVPLSIAYQSHISPASTLAMVGWQDSDSDGIFDLADVPLALDAVGYFDSATLIYHFSGTASAVPLRNQNSEGPQSDITLNRIGELQYRLDDGPWTIASSPNRPEAEFQLELAITEPFSQIQWRVVDQQSSVTSDTMTGSNLVPAVSSGRLLGYAFRDDNDDGVRGPNEPLLSGVTARIQHSDGTPISSQSIVADQLPDGKISSANSPDVILSTHGVGLDSTVGVRSSALFNGNKLFQAYNAQYLEWTPHWNEKTVFVATPDQPTGEVELTLVAGSEPSYGRLEAYDATGELIGRTTTGPIALGQTVSLSFADPQGRIASIRAFGHAGTSIGIAEFRFGQPSWVTTDASGLWQFDHLADGDYRVELTLPEPLLQFGQPTLLLQAGVGGPAIVASAAGEVSNPWHNQALPGDVNHDGQVTANDALVVINDLTASGARELSGDPASGEYIDVNSDGSVSALDALIVINALTDFGSGGAAFEVAQSELTLPNEGEAAGALQSDVVGALAAINPQMSVDRAMSEWSDTPIGADLRPEFSRNLLRKTVVNGNGLTTIEFDSLNCDDLLENEGELNSLNRDRFAPKLWNHSAQTDV